MNPQALAMRYRSRRCASLIHRFRSWFSGFLVRPQAICLHDSLPCNFRDYHFHAATFHRHLTDLACEHAVFAVCEGVAYVLVRASENFRDSSVFAVLDYDFFLHILAFLYF